MPVIPDTKTFSADQLQPLLAADTDLTLTGMVFSDLYNTMPPEGSLEQPETYHLFTGTEDTRLTIVAATPGGRVKAVLQVATPEEIDPRIRQAGTEGIYRKTRFAADYGLPDGLVAEYVCEVRDDAQAEVFAQTMHELAMGILSMFETVATGEKFVVSRLRWELQFRPILNDTILYSELGDFQTEATVEDIVKRIMVDDEYGAAVITFTVAEYNPYYIRHLALMLQWQAEELGFDPADLHCETAFVGEFYLFLAINKRNRLRLSHLMSQFAGNDFPKPELIQ